MTTLLNLFYSIPALIGAFCVAITLIVVLAPWDKIIRYCTLIPLIGLICVVLWVEHMCKRFCDWMRKPSSWEDDFPELFI